MSKNKPTKEQIKNIILNKQKGIVKKQSSESDTDEMKKYNINPDSYEDESDNEDLSDYRVDGYHPTFLGEKFHSGRYQVVQKLGWGHFSTVWLALDKKKNEHVALKIQKSKKSYCESAIDEMELLRHMNANAGNKVWLDFIADFNQSQSGNNWIKKEKLTIEALRKTRSNSKSRSSSSESESSPDAQVIKYAYEEDMGSIEQRMSVEENYCVKLLDNFQHFGVHGKHYCSAFEIMGPTLLDLIQHFDQYDRQIGIWLVKIITRQILQGLVYMHEACQMIHTDLKPENIMIQLKDNYLNEFVEDIKKLKKKPTSMKFLAIQAVKNQSKNKNKKKKKNKNKNKVDQVGDQAKQVENVAIPVQNVAIPIENVAIPLENEANPIEDVTNILEDIILKESISNPMENVKISEEIIQNETIQLNEIEKVQSTGIKAQLEDQKQNFKSQNLTKEKTTTKSNQNKKQKPPVNKKEFISDHESDYSDVDDERSKKSGSSQSSSSSSAAPYVDDETLYTLKWKEHIMIKLDRNLKIKIVDFGNACYCNKKFTDSIQTREYRAPEVIIGVDYQANTDIWSLACLVFELLTCNYLFKPKKGKGYGKSDDHLALMVETLGKMNKNLALSGSRSRDYFNKNGQLINIKDLRRMSLQELLISDYDIPEKEAFAIEDFLLPMLEYDPKKRINAREALKHPWLWTK